MSQPVMGYISFLLMEGMYKRGRHQSCTAAGDTYFVICFVKSIRSLWTQTYRAANIWSDQMIHLRGLLNIACVNLAQNNSVIVLYFLVFWVHYRTQVELLLLVTIWSPVSSQTALALIRFKLQNTS